MIGEIRDGIAQGRKLPVQHRSHARFGRMHDQVVESIVAMHDADPFLRWCPTGKPSDQVMHFRDRFRFRGLILLGPARDLPFQKVAGAAEIGNANRGRVDPVQGCDGRVHLIVDCAAIRVGKAGQFLVPKDAPCDKVHQVEGRADHRGVLAKVMNTGDRHRAVLQGPQDAELAINSMGAWQQRALRLAAQDI